MGALCLAPRVEAARREANRGMDRYRRVRGSSRARDGALPARHCSRQSTEVSRRRRGTAARSLVLELAFIALLVAGLYLFLLSRRPRAEIAGRPTARAASVLPRCSGGSSEAKIPREHLRPVAVPRGDRVRRVRARGRAQRSRGGDTDGPVSTTKSWYRTDYSMPSLSSTLAVRTSRPRAPATPLNRHVILHGRRLDFATEVNSTKVLMAFDLLAQVVRLAEESRARARAS